MYQSFFFNQTPTANIKIHVKIITTSAINLAAFEDKELFKQKCKEGCPNYGTKWACPPYSPTYNKISANYSYATLVLYYCELDQFSYTKTEYMRVKAANSILKSKMDNFLRSLESRFEGIMLSNGSCRLCKPCSCKEKTSPCKRPDKVRYSMESLGLNVEEISKEYFSHPLLWYKNKKAPQYTSVIGCLLTNSLIKESTI